MPLKKATGNMYEWTTHVHSHLRGVCPHSCAYCYVAAMARRFSLLTYTGPLRLDERELAVNYGQGRTIFIEHCSDLFAAAVPANYIEDILGHCRRYPGNRYVFQTKNPDRVAGFLDRLPGEVMLGTTIESNRQHPCMGAAPPPLERAAALAAIRRQRPALPLFVTVEPILALDPEALVAALVAIPPDFVNIGADSKSHGLPEPSWPTVATLISELQDAGIEIREKTNLERLRRTQTK